MLKMVKIGRTGHDIGERLSQPYSSGVPLPFECAYAARVMKLSPPSAGLESDNDALQDRLSAD